MPHHFNQQNRQSLEAPAEMPWDVELRIVRGRARQPIRPVTSPAFLIGSAGDCDLVLGDPQFADVHAYLLTNADGVTLRHLGFKPEMTVNGMAVSHIQLAHGDRIRTGPYEFEVTLQKPRQRPRRPHLHKLLEQAAADRVEEQAAASEVFALIKQVRIEMSVPSNRLRLYCETNEDTPAAKAALRRTGSQ